MQKIQLYVEDTLIDLFDDENINITSTIQDVRDIGKVFTDFTQTFTVPASKTNNKVFRHYYNYNITGNAFDSRTKKTARIEINYMPFREGKIFLNSVKMKSNKAYAYEIIFYGNTVSLKDLLGDDELTELPYLSNFDHDYTDSIVRNGFSDGLDFTIDSVLKPQSVIYPLITTKKRLFFNSDDPISTNPIEYDFLNTNGNLYHKQILNQDGTVTPNGDPTRGLEFTDLKPAMRLIHIIEAIEDKYNIQFTRSIRKSDGTDRKTFFDSEAFIGNDTTNYYGLYMWLHRNKGDLFEYDVEGSDFKVNFSSWVALPGNHGIGTFSLERLTVDSITDPNIDGYNLRLFVYPDTAFLTDRYTISILDFDTNVVLTSKTGRGNQTIGLDIIDDLDISKSYKFVIEGATEITFDTSNKPRVELSTFDGDRNVLEVDQWESDAVALDRRVVMGESFPKIKVIDFLTGLFKMFNLTAYYIQDRSDVNYGKIYVDTLDNFYSDSIHNPLGGTINIDDYLHIDEHTVNTVLPYTDIDFQYKETNVVLMENHLAQFNEVFGNSEYNVRDLIKSQEGTYIDRAKKYDISLPFSHLKYERLVNGGTNLPANATSSTGIQWGYCATGEFSYDEEENTGDYDRTTIAPLIFYGIREEGLPNISSDNLSGKINWISSSPDPVGIANYFRPSNSYDDGTPTFFIPSTNELRIGTPPKYSLNFDQEYDEWQGENYGDNSNSLFNVYYKNYIESVFNAAKRMFKVSAHLPANIITSLRLNDKIKIQDSLFQINSIDINLNSGKSELELLNIFSVEEYEAAELRADMDTITSDSTVITADATEF